MCFKQPIVFYFLIFFIFPHIVFVSSNVYSSYNSLLSCRFIFFFLKNFPQYLLSRRNTIDKFLLLLLSSKKYISFSDVSLSELTLNDLWKRLNCFLTLIEKREKKRGTINIIRLESYYHLLHTGVWSYQLEKNYSSLANRVKSLFLSAAPDWLIPAYSELRGNKHSLWGLSLCEN